MTFEVSEKEVVQISALVIWLVGSFNPLEAKTSLNNLAETKWGVTPMVNVCVPFCS